MNNKIMYYEDYQIIINTLKSDLVSEEEILTSFTNNILEDKEQIITKCLFKNKRREIAFSSSIDLFLSQDNLNEQEQLSINITKDYLIMSEEERKNIYQEEEYFLYLDDLSSNLVDYLQIQKNIQKIKDEIKTNLKLQLTAPHQDSTSGSSKNEDDTPFKVGSSALEITDYHPEIKKTPLSYIKYLDTKKVIYYFTEKEEKQFVEKERILDEKKFTQIRRLYNARSAYFEILDKSRQKENSDNTIALTKLMLYLAENIFFYSIRDTKNFETDPIYQETITYLTHNEDIKYYDHAYTEFNKYYRLLDPNKKEEVRKVLKSMKKTKQYYDVLVSDIHLSSTETPPLITPEELRGRINKQITKQEDKELQRNVEDMIYGMNKVKETTALINGKWSYLEELIRKDELSKEDRLILKKVLKREEI